MIITELAQSNLEDFINKYQGPVPEAKILHLFSQILLALYYLHRLHIDHRDLKPQNILLFDHGQSVKLADFGLAKEITDVEEMSAGIGTKVYQAPEAREGKA